MRSKTLAAILAVGLTLGCATAAPAVTPQGSTPKPTPPGRGPATQVPHDRPDRPGGDQWGPRREFPRGPLGTARIKLERTACFGTCPVYTVEIQGDGTVIWEGKRFVKVMGLRRYRIPIVKVRTLVERFRAARFYSARDAYVDRGITDMPSAWISLTYGGVSKRIQDYAGTRAGMPQAIKDLERAVDETAGTAALIGPPQTGRR